MVNVIFNIRVACRDPITSYWDLSKRLRLSSSSKRNEKSIKKDTTLFNFLDMFGRYNRHRQCNG